MIYLYPTDTLWALGVDATDAGALGRLRSLKGSGAEKHYSIMVADMVMMRGYAVVTPLAERLALEFLPGALTLVLEAKNLPAEAVAEDGSIGIRIPNNPVALELVQKLGHPLTCTSANISGQLSLQSPEEIMQQFKSAERDVSDIMILHNMGIMGKSEPSTVVDARGDSPIIIRQGACKVIDMGIQY